MTSEAQQIELEEGLRDAWKIIDVLYMDALDNNGESWPRAREWQEKWAKFKPNIQDKATSPVKHNIIEY